jgi:hypothetical protein
MNLVGNLLKAKAKAHRLHARQVDRIALCDEPAVPDARIVLFKRADSSFDDDAEKEATKFLDLPLAEEDTKWDGAAAEKRVREWAGGPDKDKIDFEKYRQAFMWFDNDAPEDLKSYKLGYADVVDGKLKAVPNGIHAVVRALAGSRNPVDIPMKDKKKVATHCKKYYEKMKKEFPEIVIKREVDFYSAYIKSAMRAAQSALGQELWYVVHSTDDVGNRKAIATKLFKDFGDVMIGLAESIENKSVVLPKQLDAGMEAGEFSVDGFLFEAKDASIGVCFSVFDAYVEHFIAMEDVTGMKTNIEKLVAAFKDMVLPLVAEITEEKMDEELEEMQKSGRKISTARLKKLKAVVTELATLISEVDVDVDVTEKSRKEGDEMDLQEMEKKITDFEGVLTAIEPRLKAIEDALPKEKSKEEQEAEQLKSRAIAAGLPEDATKEQVETKEKELKDAKEQEEEKAKDEKKQAEDRISAFEKGVKAITDRLTVIEQKFGIKTSSDDDPVQEPQGDPQAFDKALKKKTSSVKEGQ